MDFPQELRNILTPGNSVKVYYGKGNPNNQLQHIRAIIDNDQVVYKVWF